MEKLIVFLLSWTVTPKPGEKENSQSPKLCLHMAHFLAPSAKKKKKKGLISRTQLRREAEARAKCGAFYSIICAGRSPVNQSLVPALIIRSLEEFGGSSE